MFSNYPMFSLLFLARLHRNYTDYLTLLLSKAAVLPVYVSTFQRDPAFSASPHRYIHYVPDLQHFYQFLAKIHRPDLIPFLRFQMTQVSPANLTTRI